MPHQVTLETLPDNLLLEVFSHLNSHVSTGYNTQSRSIHFRGTALFTLPRVCKRFNELLQQPSSPVDCPHNRTEGSARPARQGMHASFEPLALWLAHRRSAVRHLQLYSSAAGVLVLGWVSSALQVLEIECKDYTSLQYMLNAAGCCLELHNVSISMWNSDVQGGVISLEWLLSLSKLRTLTVKGDVTVSALSPLVRLCSGLTELALPCLPANIVAIHELANLQRLTLSEEYTGPVRIELSTLTQLTSFNLLCAEAHVSFAPSPCLRELHITGNVSHLTRYGSLSGLCNP